ncbi:MAG: aspartate carbamoyltransferase, partial [Clostridia bacterium]|nr:aspartate carbamoyltransferase [Clostridia bacterium]
PSSVINAGDGCNEHPTQALLDMFTIWERFGRLEGLKIAIVGDILHSRVARSNLYALKTMGADVRLAGPPTLLPLGLSSCNVDEAVEGADVVMALRLQKERQQKGLLPSLREYSVLYGINEERMAKARPGAMVMHPGPMNRGVEISSAVADCVESVIDEQVENGVAVRMALLYLVTREDNKR